MKAIRIYEFGPPEVMKLEEVPDLKPGLGQVAVRMHAAGVNPVAARMLSRPCAKNHRSMRCPSELLSPRVQRSTSRTPLPIVRSSSGRRPVLAR